MALNAISVGVGRRYRSFFCECVAGTVLLILLLLLLLLLLSLLSSNVFVVVVMMLQNRQVMVTSFGCCWYSGGAPRVLIVGVPAISRARWVLGWGGWRVILILLWKMYVRIVCKI